MLMTRYAPQGMSVLLAALILSCGLGQAETMDELYAKARPKNRWRSMPAAR
jgi:hypothetical protein